MALALPQMQSSALSQADIQLMISRAPDLLRQQMAIVPDNAKDTTPYRAVGIGVGAILGIATFTKMVPGYWKWLTGGLTLGSAAAGLVAGTVRDQVNTTMGCVIPEAKQAMFDYAAALENNAALQQQFAGYLATHVSPAEIATRKPDDLIVAKAVEFGFTTPYYNREAMMARITNNCSPSL